MTSPAPVIPALTWTAWAGAANLATLIVCNFDAFSSYEIPPFGQFSRDQVYADGVIVRNLDNQTPVTLKLGPSMKFTVPAFKQDNLALRPGYPPLIIEGTSGLVELIFYKGAFPAALQNSNDFELQKVAALGTLANGTADAYLNTLRWNENIQLDALTDLNGVLIGGFYDCVSPVNGPGAGTWNIEVQPSSLGSAYLTQIARPVDQGSAVIYVRRRIAGVWNVWSAQINSDGAAFLGPVSTTDSFSAAQNVTAGDLLTAARGSIAGDFAVNTLLTAAKGSIAGDFTVNNRQLNPVKCPAFLARNNADIPIANGSGVVTLANVAQNRGATFNNTRFTATIAGAYQFSGGISFATGAASTGYYAVSLRINGAYAAGPLYTVAPASASVIASASVAATLQLAAGDYVELWWELSSAAGSWAMQNGRCFFSGQYVG